MGPSPKSVLTLTPTHPTRKCEINGALYGTDLINAVAEAGGTDSLGEPGSEAWSEVLREATLTGVEITYIVPAFEWLDEEETQGLFVTERLYTKVPDHLTLSVTGAITAAGLLTERWLFWRQREDWRC